MAVHRNRSSGPAVTSPITVAGISYGQAAGFVQAAIMASETSV